MPALRQSLLIVAHCLTAVFALTLPVAAQTPEPRYERSTARVVEFGDQRPKTPRRVAVVGDVERPGVYESTAKRLVAETVLKAAGCRTLPGQYFTRFHGGLTKVPAPVLNADTVDLLSGDVIVADVAQTRITDRNNKRIHVAVIGLQPDPVVINVPESDRSLPGLFSRLRQQSTAAAAATVNGAKSTELLKNGDVIVVGSYLIDRAALMGCEGILAPISLDTVSEAPKATTKWSPPVALPTVSELPPLVTPSLGEVLPQPERVATVEPPPASHAEPVRVASIQPVESIATSIPPSFVTRAEQEQPSESRRLPELAARREVAQKSRVQTAAFDPDAEVRNLVILIALGTLGIGIALLWMASERRLKSVAAPEPVELKPVPVPVPASEEPKAVEQPKVIEQPKQAERPAVVVDKDDLAQLIRGELPVVDEPVVLPARVALHGKAVGQKRLVIHPPQSLAGPHFGAASAAEEKVAAGRESKPVVNASTPVNPSSPVRSQKETEGLLDRVLLAMQREGRK